MPSLRLMFLAILISLGLVSGQSRAFAWYEPEDMHDPRVNGSTWFHWQKLDFDELEAWAAEVREQKRALDTRDYLAFDFYLSHWSGQTTENVMDVDGSWQYAFKAWKEVRPQSPAPHLAHAAKLYHLAGYYRGHGYANEVSVEDLKQAQAYWLEAYDYLLEHKHIAETDYVWYELMFMLETRLPIAKHKAYERLVEGIQRYPDNVRLYVLGARYLLPKWGGSWDDLNAWVKTVVRHTKERHGLAMYAHIFGHLRSDEDLYVQPYLWPKHWARIQQGMADIDRMSPEANVDVWFTKLACAARDETAIAKFRVRLDQKGISKLTKESAREYCAWDTLKKAGFRLTKLPIPDIR